MSQFPTDECQARDVLTIENERDVPVLTQPPGFLRSVLFVFLSSTASVGCAHGVALSNSADSPAHAHDQVHAQVQDPSGQTATDPAVRPNDDARAQALEAVAHRGSPAIEADGVVFSRTPAGSVALEAELRGRVASDAAMAARDVDIDVDGGVVRLSGSVPDAFFAARLVDMALALPGVRAVESSLAWVSRAEIQELDDSAARAASAAR
jgi:hypothetical protein